MRRLILAGLVLAQPALAQEPLVLRIRPPDETEAYAAREAVWQRSAVRAHRAIASVCTGCLRPDPTPAPPADALFASTGDP